MKKFLYSSLLLVIAGAVFSFALLYSHYTPDANMLFLSCGSGLDNPCITVGQSSAGSLFGIPLAAFGLFFYFFFLFTLLIADYAQKDYLELVVYLLLPLSGLAVLLNIYLGVVMIQIGEFCSLCFYTYLVNGALLATLLLWFKGIRKESSESLFSRIKTLLRIDEPDSHKRAAFSSYTLFAILLVFAVFSTNTIMTYKAGGPSVPRNQINKFLTNFYQQKPVDIELPESPYSLGSPDAKLTAYVFTDYLCSACYGFYKVEKFLLAKYKGKIRFVYYHFPLSGTCNQDESQTSSCIASRAMHAAIKTGIYKEYLVEHFKNYKRMKREYNEEWALQILSDLKKKGVAENVDAAIFREMMYEEETAALINSQVDASTALNVNATPTIIIAGRTLRGVPPKEMMSALIDNELKK